MLKMKILTVFPATSPSMPSLEGCAKWKIKLKQTKSNL